LGKRLFSEEQFAYPAIRIPQSEISHLGQGLCDLKPDITEIHTSIHLVKGSTSPYKPCIAFCLVRLCKEMNKPCRNTGQLG